MPRSKPPIICQCCGKAQPHGDYNIGVNICSLCDSLSAREAVRLTRATLKQYNLIITSTKAGRLAARQASRLAEYNRTGKRCTACHGHKPPAAYNKCAPASDGLQPICRTCNEIRVASTRSGGLAAWHTLRAALRSGNDDK